MATNPAPSFFERQQEGLVCKFSGTREKKTTVRGVSPAPSATSMERAVNTGSKEQCSSASPSCYSYCSDAVPQERSTQPKILTRDAQSHQGKGRAALQPVVGQAFTVGLF